ncbi:S16 family serine protease [Oceanivirga miroungae]|uniref:endopeptidase La n=1 Tax=Oceanivirga miroungae TaxID=1130046 RepID=A0A6I8ME85_9FUSO|nr:S16 family serine protease [Oceanivirga miroungae]VWL85891.1 ATP-dependent protease La [Oceanivirga miroungae]
MIRVVNLKKEAKYVDVELCGKEIEFFGEFIYEDMIENDLDVEEFISQDVLELEKKYAMIPYSKRKKLRKEDICDHIITLSKNKKTGYAFMYSKVSDNSCYFLSYICEINEKGVVSVEKMGGLDDIKLNLSDLRKLKLNKREDFEILAFPEYFSKFKEEKKELYEEVLRTISSTEQNDKKRLSYIKNLNWEEYAPEEKSREDIMAAKKILDESHYGMEELKTNILRYIASNSNKNICLIGEPGVGKSSIVDSIGKALNRPVYTISLGACKNALYLKGSDSTYKDSHPGEILNIFLKCNKKAPIILLDEIDKIDQACMGIISEILDPVLNKNFRDEFLNIPYDISNALFIVTGNNKDLIPDYLKSRLEIIDIKSYSLDEKINIIKNYVLPKHLKKANLDSKVEITLEAIEQIIKNYCFESGIREATQKIETIISDIKLQKKLHNINRNIIDVDYVSKVLGKAKYESPKITDINKPKKASVVGMSISSSKKGCASVMEAVMYKGNGSLKVSGNVGEVLRESNAVAISYIKSKAKEFGINEKNIKENDIHIHFKNAAAKKDGPSGGIAITTLLISMYKNVALKQNIAMTGEISIIGEVLAVGGTNIKIEGSYESGIKEFIIPYENRDEIELISPKIKKDIKIHLVKDFMQVYNLMFAKEGNIDG